MANRAGSGQTTWTVLGRDDLALRLRQAVRYVDASEPLTVTTDPQDIPDGAIATGTAMTGDGASRVISPLYGFRVLEDAARMVSEGEVGSIYGCFASYRLERGAAQDVQHRAMPELLAWILDVFPADVRRVHTRRASLLARDDSWFVTLRLADDLLITLEAMASNSPGAGADLLVEITGSERLIRAEPTRQAVRVERIDAAETALPWWEDEAERLLQYIASRPPEPTSGRRFREVWEAVMQSGDSGKAIDI